MSNEVEPKEFSDNLVSRDCLRNLLTKVHGHHSYFTPTREFYLKVGINCRRWAKLYRGEIGVTIDELKRVCHALDVAFTAETFERQMKLFE